MDVLVNSQTESAPTFKFYSQGDVDNTVVDDFRLVNVDGDLYFAYVDVDAILPIQAGVVGEEFTVRFEFYTETSTMSVYSDGFKLFDLGLEDGIEITHAELQFTSDVAAEWYVDDVICAKVFALSAPMTSLPFDIE